MVVTDPKHPYTCTYDGKAFAVKGRYDGRGANTRRAEIAYRR